MNNVGQVLRERVAATGGCTVAVLTADTVTRGGYGLTAKATKEWPRELEERVWILDGREVPKDHLEAASLRVRVRGIMRTCGIAKRLRLFVIGDRIMIEDCEEGSRSEAEDNRGDVR